MFCITRKSCIALPAWSLNTKYYDRSNYLHTSIFLIKVTNGITQLMFVTGEIELKQTVFFVVVFFFYLMEKNLNLLCIIRLICNTLIPFHISFFSTLVLLFCQVNVYHPDSSDCIHN